MTRSRHRDEQDVWTYALVGGLVAAPLVVAHNLLAGVPNEFSFNGVLVGGLVAGFLAARASVDVDRATAGAGVLGGVPALAWFLPELVGIPSTTDGVWWFTVVEAGFVLVVVGLTLVFGVLAGVLGGFVGKWLASVVGRRTATHG